MMTSVLIDDRGSSRVRVSGGGNGGWGGGGIHVCLHDPVSGSGFTDFLFGTKGEITLTETSQRTEGRCTYQLSSGSQSANGSEI